MSVEQIFFVLALVISLVVRAVSQARADAEQKRKASPKAPAPEPEEDTRFEPAHMDPYRMELAPRREPPPVPAPVPVPPIPLPVRPPRRPAPPRPPRTRAALLQAELRNEARQRHAMVLAAVIGPPVGSQ